MTLTLERLELGPWLMNCYLIRCRHTGEVAVIDPGADPDKVLSRVSDGMVRCILLTHGHPDHVGALEAVRLALNVPVGVHLADAEEFGVDGDFPLLDGMQIMVGKTPVVVAHTPGHTPGSVSFKLNRSALVGDAIFPGGPGHTASPQALSQSLVSLGFTVFSWPDDTELFPGHGPPTTVGAERKAFERFLEGDHPPDLCGDVAWR